MKSPHVFWIAFLCLSLPGGAADILIDTSVGVGQVGGFFGPFDDIVDDPPASYPATLIPDNDASFQNYFMGRSTFGPLGTADTGSERRVFFAFDVSGVAASIPPGEVISSLSIDLELTAGGSAVLANFSGDVEIVEFSSTPFTFAEILDPVGTSTPTDAIWGSFGTGTPYGSFGIDGTAAPGGSPPGADGTFGMPADTYAIELPGAVTDLTSAVLAGGVFIVSARLATFDPDVIGPGAPPAVDPYEYVFGITDVVSPSGSTVDAPVLTITTIPEPTTPMLALVAVFGLLRRRRQLSK